MGGSHLQVVVPGLETETMTTYESGIGTVGTMGQKPSFKVIPTWGYQTQHIATCAAWIGTSRSTPFYCFVSDDQRIGHARCRVPLSVGVVGRELILCS